MVNPTVAMIRFYSVFNKVYTEVILSCLFFFNILLDSAQIFYWKFIRLMQPIFGCFLMTNTQVVIIKLRQGSWVWGVKQILEVLCGLQKAPLVMSCVNLIIVWIKEHIMS